MRGNSFFIIIENSIVSKITTRLYFRLGRGAFAGMESQEANNGAESEEKSSEGEKDQPIEKKPSYSLRDTDSRLSAIAKR